MSKEFIICDSRRVLVEKDGGDYSITIEEVGVENKSVTLTGRRFAQLTALEFLISQSVRDLFVKENVAFKVHLGGGYFVSVTSGFKCVDIRQHYFNKIKGHPSPTKQGIALRLAEWTKLKELFKEIKLNHPTLAKIESCSERADHFTLDGFLSCNECQIFRVDEELFSQKYKPSFT